MADVKQSRAAVIKEVELHTKRNNTKHHTNEITEDKLIVRRGKYFKVSVKLKEAFNPERHHFHFTAKTGELPSEDVGTMCNFGVPDNVKRSPAAIAVWKAKLKGSRRSAKDVAKFHITPPAEAPIGRYTLTAKLKDEEIELATLVVLFNPWCRADWVYLHYKNKRKEYVMNEQGTIYRGSAHRIFPSSWDFGQFEEDMVDICLKMLDLNPKHKSDPSDDVSARCNPIYVGRVISRMINSQDDWGVLAGRWDGEYDDGFSPSHWTGSHPILKRWFQNDFHPVKYGQCWVFACVMCSVMRLLGIPCRVVSNFSSAHDVDRNLTIDVYHSEEGVENKESHDSIWNFHVWVESWMKRPDLNGDYNGWQVLDPTPQETSGGVYRCGPASVKAILAGETNQKYDVPFVFAEVNADCVDWMLKADGSKVALWTDSHRVGKDISTKSIGSNKRLDVTSKYKHKEGSKKERSVFKHAVTRDYSRVDEVEEDEEEEEEEVMEEEEEDDDDEEDEEEEEEEEEEDDDEEEMDTNEGPCTGEDADSSAPSIPLTLQFEEVCKPVNGEDVKVNLVVHNMGSDAKSLCINVSVQAMNYNGTATAKIQKEVKEETLQLEKDLSIPIVVPFSAYCKPMLKSDSMKISAIVTDKAKPDNPYLAEDDVVLVDPPITVTVSGPAKLNHMTLGEVVFVNPINEVLKNCTMTLSGSGLYRDEAETKLPDVKPGEELRFPFNFAPYKKGVKKLVADFDCSYFRDIKCSCKVKVQAESHCP